jgi:CubicO group peptidase (beta-lactamase class C family)
VSIDIVSKTLIPLASASKAFISAAVSLMINDFEHGTNKIKLPDRVDNFTWKTKVQDLLPGEWGLVDKWASEKASVHDILSHLSGLPR